jgi:hypothetical protein
MNVRFSVLYEKSNPSYELPINCLHKFILLKSLLPSLLSWMDVSTDEEEELILSTGYWLFFKKYE